MWRLEESCCELGELTLRRRKRDKWNLIRSQLKARLDMMEVCWSLCRQLHTGSDEEDTALSGAVSAMFTADKPPHDRGKEEVMVAQCCMVDLFILG